MSFVRRATWLMVILAGLARAQPLVPPIAEMVLAASAPAAAFDEETPGRIVSFSIVTSIDSPPVPTTVIFEVGGADAQGEVPVLVRAVGPSLARFGTMTPNPAPVLRLLADGQPVAENRGWGGQPAVAEASARVGAFPLAADDSADAAMLVNSAVGTQRTIDISARDGASGVVLVELYDAMPDASASRHTPRFLSLSVLRPAPAGSGLSASFAIAGHTPKALLIRAVGPSLASLAVTGAMADPKLTLLQDETPIASNDDWSDAPELRAASATVGALPLEAGAKDAALIRTLGAGSYTIEVSDTLARGGIVLLEIYELP